VKGQQHLLVAGLQTWVKHALLELQLPPGGMLPVCAATGRELKLRPATVSMLKIAKFLKVPKRVIGLPFLVV